MIYERVALETMVLRDFTKSCSPTDIARVHYCYEQMLDAAKATDDLALFDINEFLAVDLKMHEAWFLAMDKSYLWERITAPIRTTPALSDWISSAQKMCRMFW